ncbi:glycosyltransferase, partial [Staphylococcus aureus]|uniref:glycosyltransferase n=1 Tax=Staphylococcus aureus TaxID=1280 RepID=UPI0039BE99C8
KNGYEYELITLDNCFTGSKYIQECLNSPHRPGIKYCKASDYLRMYYLKNFGGVYLDSDVEMLLEGPGFDHLLNQRMFVGEEGCETIPGTIVLGSAVIGAEANHPFIAELLETLERDYRGDTDDNYSCSMHQMNIRGVKHQNSLVIMSP